MKGFIMNTDIVAGKWKQVVAKAKGEWAKLTDDDLKKAEAGHDHLVGVVQEKYGNTKEEAHKQVQAFWEKHDPDRPS
jgi:uncharacterized protein YjbJ (UPF0337 family)